ncbi:hypothetical protein [Rhodothermus marinus]|uniref:Lipoprotein n=1 Tax=Rhodothermus marinus (strain ATCC 43812 / DSM 4252 / R-10) TaxID=518766 RepID=D0MIK2_RHOM4|nr:hypothetical protein [Rhodothermus marinus]ACY48310.1 hypothetical protein Rmar_1423 [Rhodothermus marinus DSM 4252]
MPLKKVAGAVGVLLLAAFLVGGCQLRESYRVAQLLVHRRGWDSVRVDVQFQKRRWLSSAEPVVPDSIQVLLLNAQYDTLYLGNATAIPVPDARLGDRERLLLEVCGWFGRRSVCDQLGLNASPKRVVVAPEIVYPYQGTTARLYYRLHPRLERRRYDDEGWEPLPVRRVLQGYLLVGTEADPRSRLRIPLQAWEGVVELASLPDFPDFRYTLQQQFRAGRPAVVTFEVYGGMEQPELLASLSKRLRPKTEAERKEEVAHFVSEALRQVVAHLSGRPYPVWLRVESWSFNPLTLQYVAEVSARWREGGWFRPSSELFGVLTVSEDGTGATFRWVSGNRRAEERWRQQVGQEILHLSDLPLPEIPKTEEETVVSGW